ncbi:MAG: hypothetical protein WBD36_07730 [Bacteroidota bacterium]
MLHKASIIIGIRWVGALPVAYFAYIVSISIFDFGVKRIDPELVQDVIPAFGFAGHYILGPLFVFSRFASATFAGMAVAMKVAPNNRVVAGMVILGAYVLMLFPVTFLFGKQSAQIDWTFGYVVRLVVEVGAQIIGMIAAIQIVRREELDRSAAG